MREKPLLEEIRTLRVGKEEAERRMRQLEVENQALMNRVRDLEAREVKARREVQAVVQCADANMFQFDIAPKRQKSQKKKRTSTSAKRRHSKLRKEATPSVTFYKGKENFSRSEQHHPSSREQSTGRKHLISRDC